MSDEFIHYVGEIAMDFAWLEDAVAELLNTLCGSERAFVFTDDLRFEAKLQRILAFLKIEPLLGSAAELPKLVERCRQAAKGRNEALHARHIVENGRWQRLKKDTTTDVSVAELRDVAN